MASERYSATTAVQSMSRRKFGLETSARQKGQYTVSVRTAIPHDGQVISGMVTLSIASISEGENT
jgi:hypothetical protein